MTTLPDGECVALADSVRAACQRLAPEERVRSVAYDRTGRDAGVDKELWTVLCRQIGLAGIAAPESLGGAGYGASVQAVIAHELGRVLAPVPFLPSAVLATGLLVVAGASTELLKGLIEGEKTAAAVVETSGGRWDRKWATLTARRQLAGWTIRGRVRHVLNGAAAEDLAVVATVDSEPAIFIVESAQPGVDVKAEHVLDRTRPMATITLDDASAQRLSSAQPVAHLIDECLRHALAVLSAEQVGACERVLEMASEYARTRVQFGRPIGAFQAVKHRCADMLVALEMARSASMAALQSVDDGDGDAFWLVHMAKAVCSEALRDASHANLQIHGGIGFTWEHAAGLFVKRARTDEVLFGRPGEHWDQVAAGADLFADQRAAGPTAKTEESVAG